MYKFRKITFLMGSCYLEVSNALERSRNMLNGTHCCPYQLLFGLPGLMCHIQLNDQIRFHTNFKKNWLYSKEDES